MQKLLKLPTLHTLLKGRSKKPVTSTLPKYGAYTAVFDIYIFYRSKKSEWTGE